MVDRPARQEVIRNLEGALEGKTTNWDFDDSWPKSKDRVIQAMEERLWEFYDDNRKAVLNISTMRFDAVPLFERCLAFLRSDLEYEWPDYKFRKTGVAYFNSMFNKAREATSWKKFEAFGNIEVWPFSRSADVPEIGSGDR